MAENEKGYRFGLIGWPLVFSLSPLIHREFLRATGHSGEYSAYPVFPDKFRKSVTELLDSGVTGLNVTYPYKEAAAAMCHEISSEAVDLNAINTMKMENGCISGYNTDIYGFNCYVDENRLKEPFFVTGSGGAARAVDYVLHGRGLQYRFFCRNPLKWKGTVRAENLDELNGSLKKADNGTVINATTLGWKNDDDFPVEPSLLANRVFADLNYNRLWRWRNDLGNLNVNVITGEIMLVHQAAKSFEIWTGTMPGTAAVLEMVAEMLEESRKGCDIS